LRLRADLEQPQPNRWALRLLHLGAAQTKASHLIHQEIGEDESRSNCYENATLVFLEEDYTGCG
jgi:hypothetical protein